MTQPDPPDPVDPQRDDSPTVPVDLPPFPSPLPAAEPGLPPAGATPVGPTPPSATPPAGAAPWDAPGPIPPAGPWAAPPGSAPVSAPAPVPAPAPAGAASAPGAPAWSAAGGPPQGPPAPQAPQAAQAPQAPAGLVAGIVLVVIGVAFLLIQLADMTQGSVSWPLWLIVPGLAMLAGSFAIPPRGGLGLAVPGTMLAIVGAILWVQDTYDLWATWAYAWALVAPTGPGLAMLLYGLVRGDRELAADGFRTFLVGIGLFLGFAFFFEGVIGISGHRIANLDEVLPYIVIGFGVLLVVASLFGGRRGRRDEGGAGGA